MISPEELVERIWERDPTVWTGHDEAQWLGWLDEPLRMRQRAGEIGEFAQAIRGEVDEVVLLGMGGSSLAPEVFRRQFGATAFHVLDTTHPKAIRRLADSLDLERTLFVVSSKSGSTLETRSHYDFFWERSKRGDRFVAVTDPGSALEDLARSRGSRAFPGEPTIGGRYSALSMFGLLPAALMSVDLGRLLDRAESMLNACHGADSNPGLELGLALGSAWQEGRDKVVFPFENGLGLWLEQLLAESTGKEGKGLVPAPGERPDYPDRQTQSLELDDPYDLGSEFFRWEFATAVAGAILEINPFDQPNVQEAKDRTSTILAGGNPELELLPADGLIAQAREGDYVAIQAFVDPAEEARLQGFVDRVRSETSCAVTFGLGPRYLHSTGQLHKGGAPIGCFLQIVDDVGEELAIPGQPFGFGRLIQAQAAGDYAALKERGRPVARIRLEEIGRMNLGMVGLGRMGANMTERLREHGHTVETYARTNPERTANSLVELASKLPQPRVVWLMIPAGDPTENAFQTLLGLLEEGDVIVDGGNSNFRDSQRRAEEAEKKSVAFLDAGVSGGIWGLKEGYCVMVGGDAAAYKQITPFLEDLTEPGGHAHVGPSGAGHFVKMVHNGIEYGMMQSLAEGFEIMQASEFPVNLHKTAALWQHGSVVRSWLLDLLVLALEEDPNLEQIRGYVEDSGEGRWTVMNAIDESVPAPAITLSLFARFASRQDESFAAKVNAALRNQFGGHAVKTVDEE